MNSQITDFVHEALLRGISREDISKSLLKGGWTLKEINSTLDGFVDCSLPLPVPRKRVSGSAREAFLFLMLFSALYTAVFALGSVLFDLINLNLSKPGEMIALSIGSLRYGIASVVVSFPIFIFMNKVIARAALRNPGQRISPVRRWLTYLTLFIASVSIVTDIIALIVRFLSGDLTLRFGLKILVVAMLAGIVFFYYLRDLRRDEITYVNEHGSTKLAKIVFSVLAIVVLVIIGFGFWTAGSPATARLQAEDEQRIVDLADIGRKVGLYYQNKGALPESLSACDISPGTYINQKKDRVTGEAYLYRVIDDTHFEVEATFSLPTSPASPNNSTGTFPGFPRQNAGFWEHESGRKTFVIDVTGEKQP